MAREHDQKRTKGQKPDLNEIQPGMEVEDTGHELGEGDISKPRVSNVIRDKQGQARTGGQEGPWRNCHRDNPGR